MKAREVRPTTLRSYMQTLCHIAPQVGHRPLAELTALHVEEAVGMLERNVAEQVRRLRTPKPELKVWTPQQARAFLAVAVGHRLCPLFALAFSTGMREVSPRGSG